MKDYSKDERHNYWRRHLLDTDQFEELKKEYREEDRKKLKFELFKIFLKGYYEHNLIEKHYSEHDVIKEAIRNCKWAYDKFFEEMDK